MLINLSDILKQVLIESVSVNNVNDAIDKKYQVEIEYHSNGEDEAIGPRIIEVYAYGLTKTGNPVIRAFQPYGDTTTSIPNWKFFRLDRITKWKPTNRYFTQPASDYYSNVGAFNPEGDKSMSVVYNIARFGDEPESKQDSPINAPSGPRQKQDLAYSTPKFNDNVFKTDTERSMDKLKKQVDNPIYAPGYGPKRKEEPENTVPTDQEPTPQQVGGPKIKDTSKDVEPFKTDTEKDIERKRNNLNNPQRVSQDVLDNWRKEQDRRNNRQNNKNRQI